MRRLPAAALFAAVLLAEASAASAQVPDPLTREYMNSLRLVYAEIRSLGLVNEVCGEAFPESKAANAAALQAWRSRYRGLLEEVERRWKAAAQSPGQKDLAAAFEEELQGKKPEVARGMKSRGEEEFRKNCASVYPKLLESERADLEKRFAPVVATIRRGYGETFVLTEAAGAKAEPLIDGHRLTEFPPLDKPPAVRLVDAGQAPKRELRMRQRQGSEYSATISMQMGMSGRMDGQQSPRLRIPGLEMTVNFRVVEADEQRARVEFSMQELPRLRDTEGIQPRLLEQTRGELSAFGAFRGHIVVDSRGVTQEVRLAPVQSASAHVRQLLQSMGQSMEQLSVPLPAEAVGAGAHWKSLEHVERNGIKLYQVASFRVQRIEGTLVTLAIEVDQFAPPQSVRMVGQPPGASAELVRMRSSRRGERTLDMASPAVTARLSLDTEIVTNRRIGNIVSQTAVEMEEQIRFQPAAAR